MFAAVMIGLAVIASDPAPSPPVASTGSGPTAAAPGRSTSADSTRLICRKETAPNSRLTKRVCMTAAEWEERAETGRTAVEDIQKQPRTN